MYQIEWLAIGQTQVPAQILFHLGPSDRLLPVTAYAMLLTGPDGRYHLVDTGVRSTAEINAGRPAERHWSVDPEKTLLRQLAQRGIAPEAVATVILTHLHYDHCSQVPLFPQADLVLSLREWLSVVAPQDPELLRFTRYPRDVYAWMVDKGWPRLRLVEDGEEVLPGMVAWVLGGHTPGSTAYRVDTAAGAVVLAGDFVNTYTNWNAGHPPGLLVSLEEWYRGYRRLRHADALIIPSHDPAVMARYPDGVIIPGEVENAPREE